MPDEQELLKQAQTLGQAIASHETVKAFLAASDAVMKDSDAQRLLTDYQKQADHLSQLEMEQKPIGVDDKRKLRDAQTAMAGHPALKTLMRTQADYSYLMTRIHQAMEEPLMPKSE